MKHDESVLNQDEQELYNLELFISKMLRLGVLVSGALLLIGWMTQIQFTENPFLAFHEYHALPLSQFLGQLWAAGDWGMLVSFAGLFVLISLPLLRVLLTAILFLRQGERKLALIAAFVLIMLLISFSLGIEI